MDKRKILGTIVVMMALAGCGSSGSDGSDDAGRDSSSATTAVDASDPGTGGGGCDGFTDGEDGVIRTFCDGTAKATVTIDGTDHEFSGGECIEAGDTLSVNIGVVTGSGATGDLPDYFGANVPVAEGDFGGEGTVLTFVYDGTAGSLQDVTGTHEGDSGTFSGTPIAGGEKVTGTFSC